MAKAPAPPILSRKNCDEPSVFDPRNLLRESRRQNSLPDGNVPRICVLDPDGDIVRYLTHAGKATLNPTWACYHTQLYDFVLDGIDFGIVGMAVGASFAVLVAEELFASGCGLLISVTSSGQILPVRDPPYFILIQKSLRDEGTSYHYVPPSDYSAIAEDLLALLDGAFSGLPQPVECGITWTTDAPFRETDSAIRYCRSKGIMAVEMEAAALYAFARAKAKPVICFAHVTNRMGTVEGDFEKGGSTGTHASLSVVAAAAKKWMGKFEARS